MGCEVVSVYNDQVLGKVGYSQSTINDLIDRDYRQLKTLPNPIQTTNKIKYLYGFTASYTTSKLFFTMINNKEHFVYTAGRFIIMEEVKSKQQIVMTNPDYVSAYTVEKKLCLVGFIGGVLLLWDLEFQQVKMEILLPEQSTTLSTVGLTSKYIFATDSSTPNNLAFCYDLRTGKLISGKELPSLEPQVKSISIEDNTMVTVCADGLWFLVMNKVQKQLQITKGMFSRYPKTSMLCLAKVKDFVISGGVDGYIYVWRIKTLKCCRALKVNDCQIISIGVKDKFILFGCMNGRVKVYTFEVKKRQKKEYILEVHQDEEDDDEEVAFIVVDSYAKEGQTIFIAPSVADPLVYYCQTRQGLMYQNWLPASIHDKRSLERRLNSDQTIQRFNSSGSVILHKDKMYSAYRGAKNLLFIDIYCLSQNKPTLQSQRVALLSQDCSQDNITYSISTQEIAYLTLTNKLQISATFNKLGEAVAHENKSDVGNNIQTLDQIQNQEIILLQYLQSQYELLCLTTNQTICIYERINKLTYEQKFHMKYQDKIPSSIKFEQNQLVYDQATNKWKQKNSKIQPLEPQIIKHHKIVHNSKLQSLQQNWTVFKISCGVSFCMGWK